MFAAAFAVGLGLRLGLYSNLFVGSRTQLVENVVQLSLHVEFVTKSVSGIVASVKVALVARS